MKRAFLIVAALGFATVAVRTRLSVAGEVSLPVLIGAMLGLVIVGYLLRREFRPRRAPISPIEAEPEAYSILGATLKGAALGACAGLSSFFLTFMVLSWPPSIWWLLFPGFVVETHPSIILACAILGATLFYADALRPRDGPLPRARLWGSIGLGAAAATAALLILPGSEKPGELRTDFHAFDSKVAFLHWTSDRQHVVVHDLATNATDVFASAGRPVTTPRFAGPSSLLVPLAPNMNPPFSLDQVKRDGALYECELNRKTCRLILLFPGKIADPVLGKDGDVVFVGAEPQVAADPFAPDRPFVSYRSHDIYVGAASRSPTRVTHESAPALFSVSYGGGIAAFDLYKASGKTRATSEIYCARVDEALAPLDFQADIEKPCLTVGRYVDRSPSISPDGNFLAFKSASDGGPKGKGWRYDIVVARRQTGEVVGRITPSGDATLTLSRPVFVSPTRIRFIELARDGYLVRSYDIGDGQARTDGRLSVESIEANNTIHVIDAPGPADR